LETIVEAIRAVSRGELWLSKRVQEKVVRRAIGEEEVPLTERELRVLRLMARGWSNQRIAKELSITERTVRFHVENILTKLGVRSRTEAVVEGVKRGLVKMGGEATWPHPGGDGAFFVYGMYLAEKPG